MTIEIPGFGVAVALCPFDAGPWRASYHDQPGYGVPQMCPGFFEETRLGS